jgi:hypothetical protein
MSGVAIDHTPIARPTPNRAMTNVATPEDRLLPSPTRTPLVEDPGISSSRRGGSSGERAKAIWNQLLADGRAAALEVPKFAETVDSRTQC